MLAQEPEPIIPPSRFYLPVLNQEACAGSGFSWESVETGERVDAVARPSERGPRGLISLILLRVEGGSMIGANIDDGCLILVNPTSRFEAAISLTSLERPLFGQRYSFYRDGRVELRPANSDFRSIWI